MNPSDWSSDVCSSDLAKQADLTAKENALKDKQAATKQAQNTLDSSKEELKGQIGRASCRERV